MASLRKSGLLALLLAATVLLPATMPAEALYPLPGPRRAQICNDYADPDCAVAIARHSIQRAGFELDMDGDGYGDSWEQEFKDFAQQLIDWLQDLDLDELKNIDEFRWQTIPIGPILGLFPNAKDYDQDNWQDGEEVRYWNDPSNDPIGPGGAVTLPTALYDPEYGENHDSDANTTTNDPDSDNDGTMDGDEFKFSFSYPEFADSDCSAEATRCLMPHQQGTTQAAQRDSNAPGTGDGISDTAERQAWSLLGADAWLNDVDRDGIASNLLDPDSDGEGLRDGSEFNCLVPPCTRPDMWDTDRDGLLDGADRALPQGRLAWLFIDTGVAYYEDGNTYHFLGERTALTNATDPDSDDDGLPDGWEALYATNPNNPNPNNDLDLDGLTNIAEYSYKCPVSPCRVSPVHWSYLDPNKRDTDGDLLLDGEEIAWQSNPRNPHSDFDGMYDGQEVHFYGTNPRFTDTDNDSLSDYVELFHYDARGADPLKYNTDYGGSPGNDDTWGDGTEIYRYHTNVTKWDTDDDGKADPWDKRPLESDTEPPRRDLSSLNNPVQPRQEAYVVFRPEGYVDVMVQDTHGNEGDIRSVDVRVTLSGTITNAPGTVTVLREAERLDDGSFWGARIGLPDGMSGSTSQQYVLTVVGSSGNVQTYTATFSHTMSGVGWSDEADPANEWDRLKVHESQARTASGSASLGLGGEPFGGVPDLRNASAETIFSTFGEFTVYRLKPLAVPAETLGLVFNASAFATVRTLAVEIENTTGAGEVVAGWNVTLFEDAFERVDPAQEPGVYAAMAGSMAYTRTPRWLREGIHSAWSEVTAQGASFAFGSDDPRARGRLTGDIIAGILVYGDARDIYLGTVQQDKVKLALGSIGFGLTFVGPQADGPFGAFKSGVLLIKSVGTAGPRVAVKLVTNVRDVVTIARNTGDPALALRIVSGHADIALWLVKNTDKMADFERVANSVDSATLNGLKNQLDNVVAMSADLARVSGDAEARAILSRLSQPSAIYPAGGTDALAEISEVAAAVRKFQDAKHPDAAALVRDLDTIKNAPNANAWWHNRAKNHIKSGTPNPADDAAKTGENSGRWGYIFEAKQAARICREANNCAKLALLDETLDDVPFGADVRPVQVDMWRLGEGGKWILTDTKSGVKTGADADNRIQMEAQAAAIRRWEDERNLKREIHWVVEGAVTKPLQQHAADIYGNYDVVVRFFDRQGKEINPGLFVPG